MAKEKHGFTGEYNYYVGVLRKEDNVLKFVTEVWWGPKEAFWNANKPALVMDKHSAIQLQMGLMCNGYQALVIEAPDFLELNNPPEEEDSK